MSALPPFADPSDLQQVNPYEAPRVVDESLGTDVEVIRHKHLSHEASVRSIGSLYYLGGFVLLMFWVPALFMVEWPLNNEGLLLLIVGAWVIILNLALGRGLRKLTSPARYTAGLLSVIGLVAFPIGTLINAYILYLLFSSKGRTIFTAEYREVIRQTPHMVYRTSFLMTIVMIALLLLFVLGMVSILFVG